MLLMASSASRSYHSSGAEFGDGIEAMLVNGESNASSGDCAKSGGSTSFGTDLLGSRGDDEVGALPWADDAGVMAASEQFVSGLLEKSAADA